MCSLIDEMLVTDAIHYACPAAVGFILTVERIFQMPEPVSVPLI